MEKTYLFKQFDTLEQSDVGQLIATYARIDNIRKSSSNLCFVILRFQQTTLQCICLKKVMGAENFDAITKIPMESLITIKGHLENLPPSQSKIESCSYHNFEFHVEGFEIVNRAVETPIFTLTNANCLYEGKCEEEEDEENNNEENNNKKRNSVLLKTRLDNRYLDLRTPLNNVIFKLQSKIVNYFREHLNNLKFTEIHSPKLLGTSSESGASVFELKYFNSKAFLAQSPQLYKQMAINADFNKVFEIGPVFRAENSFSNRHLCEFTGMDIEMQLTPPFDYLEIIFLLWNTLKYVFDGLEKTCTTEITYLKNIHTFEDFVCPDKPVIITFNQGVELLEQHGYHQSLDEDLETPNERALGEIIKAKFGSDLFVLTEYPIKARPFYTKRIEGTNFTKSYDIIMRGQEICSGAQRENDYETLIKQMTELGLSLAPFEDYLNSFKSGSPPHGGGGFGLERILMLYFNLGNVRMTSLFPRDPKRIRP